MGGGIVWGWKAIARMLDISVSWARSWEREGMPVYRRGARVWASPEELRDWVVANSQSRTGLTCGVDVEVTYE